MLMNYVGGPVMSRRLHLERPDEWVCYVALRLECRNALRSAPLSRTANALGLSRDKSVVAKSLCSETVLHFLCHASSTHVAGIALW